MSIRLYVGNLPASFDAKDLEALFGSVAAGVRFKPVHDRETGSCRGFGFANVDDLAVAEALIAQLNGRDFAGNALRIEISERREGRPGAGGSDRRASGAPVAAARRATNKVVHTDTVEEGAPDPRWAGELAKLKNLLANQTVGV